MLNRPMFNLLLTNLPPVVQTNQLANGQGKEDTHTGLFEPTDFHNLIDNLLLFTLLRQKQDDLFGRLHMEVEKLLEFAFSCTTGIKDGSSLRPHFLRFIHNSIGFAPFYNYYDCNVIHTYTPFPSFP